MTGFIKFQSLINSFNSQRSTLEHLSITSKCDLRQLPYLLSCLPQLRRLSIDYLVLGNRKPFTNLGFEEIPSTNSRR